MFKPNIKSCFKIVSVPSTRRSSVLGGYRTRNRRNPHRVPTSLQSSSISLCFRFGLTSADSGLILSSYNIASTIIIPIVGYVGGRGIKPLWIGIGIAIMGMGCLLFSFPHFITPTYEITPDSVISELVCVSNLSAPTLPPENDYVK